MQTFFPRSGAFCGRASGGVKQGNGRAGYQDLKSQIAAVQQDTTTTFDQGDKIANPDEIRRTFDRSQLEEALGSRNRSRALASNGSACPQAEQV